MPIVALLFADTASLSGPLRVAGEPPLARQRRTVAAAGAARVIVFDEDGDPGQGRAATTQALVRALGDDDRVVVLAPGLVVDAGTLAAMLACTTPAVACWPSDDAAHPGVERIDAARVAAGLGVFSGMLVRRVAGGLGDWDLASTLLRTALADRACVVPDLSGFGADPVCCRPSTDAAAAAVTRQLVAAALLAATDLPTRLIDRPVARLLVPLLLHARVPSLAVATVALAAGSVAAFAFAGGRYWSGLGLAALTGPLLALVAVLRGVRYERAPAGIARWSPPVFAVAWTLALAGRLAADIGNDGPWAVAALLLTATVAGLAARRTVAMLSGEPLAAAGIVERRLALVAASPALLPWLLLPFAVAGRWYAGFAACAGYAVVTAALTGWRTQRRLIGWAAAR